MIVLEEAKPAPALLDESGDDESPQRKHPPGETVESREAEDNSVERFLGRVER